MAIGKKAVLWALVVVPVLVLGGFGGLVAALLSVDPNSYRGVVEDQAAAALDRDVTIAGDMDLAVGLTPAIVLNDVRLANVDGSTRAHMAQVDRIEAEIELLPLLGGDLRIDRIVLVGVDLLLETGADGRPNWRFGDDGSASDTHEIRDAAEAGGGALPYDAAEAGGGVLPYVAAVAIEDARIAYAAGDIVRRLTIETAAVAAASPDSPIDWSLDGLLDATPVSVDLSSGSLRALMTDDRWTLDGDLALADARLSIVGSVAQPLAAAGADLRVVLDLPSGDAIAALTGGEPPTLPALALRARLADGGEHVALSDLTVDIGDTQITGDLRVMPHRDPLLVAGGLSAGVIDLADLSASAGADGGETVGDTAGNVGDPRLVPDRPIPYAALRTIDADLGLSVERLDLGSELIETVAAELRLDGGRLTLDVAEARVADGSATGRLVADGGADTPAIGLQVAATGLDLGGLLMRQTGSAELQGRLGLDLAVEGAGATLRQVLANGDGRVNARLGRSTVATRYLDLLGSSLVTALIPDFEQHDSSSINCAVARFDLSGGVLRTGGLVVDTPRVTIAGEGGIDLLNERIDMMLRPQVKEATLVPLAAPVRVHGALAAPAYAVDPGELVAEVGSAVLLSAINPLAVLVPLVDPGGSDGNACAAALNNPRPAPGPDGLPQRLIEGVGNAAEGAGRAAEDLGRGVGEALGGAADDAGRAIESLFGN